MTNVPARARIFATLALALSACGSRATTGTSARSVADPAVIVPGQAPVVGALPIEAPPASPLPPMPDALVVPSQVHGRLEVGDMPMPGAPTPSGYGSIGTLPTNAVCDNYVLELTAGHPVTIVARGERPDVFETPLDMYLYLYHDRDLLAQDDDSARVGEFANSRIVFTPTETGRYLLRVTTYGSAFHAGPYVIQTYDSDLPTQL